MRIVVTRAPSKRKNSHGRMTDVMKKIRLSSHKTGQDCLCKRFKCFENVTEEERKRILREFNGLKTYDTQKEYLGGLITIFQIQRRRNRNPHMSTKFNNCSYVLMVLCSMWKYVTKLLCHFMPYQQKGYKL